MKRTSTLLFSLLLWINLLIYNINALEAESIVGGEVAIRGQIKYQVSIQTNGAHLCGGGVIGDRHILTAAHCVIGLDEKFRNDPLTVVAGAIDATDSSGVSIDAEKVYVPKVFKYKTAALAYQETGDIAVLKLKSGLGLGKNPNIIKLELPQSPFPSYAGTTAVVSGFGYTWAKLSSSRSKIDGGSDNKLKFAKVDVRANNWCIQMYATPIHSSLICAAVQQKSNSKPEGTCSGDSGSPLVYGNQTVIGILSSSPPSCSENLQGGTYTRVSYYKSFIDDALNDKNTNNTRVAVFKTESSWFGLFKTHTWNEI